MTVRITYTKDELIELVAQNLDQCDDPDWVAKMATKIVGPRITWNAAHAEYQEHDE